MGRTQHNEAQEHRADVYARITQEIVAAIEAALASNVDAKLKGWKMPWYHDGSDLARPSTSPPRPGTAA